LEAIRRADAFGLGWLQKQTKHSPETGLQTVSKRGWWRWGSWSKARADRVTQLRKRGSTEDDLAGAETDGARWGRAWTA